MKYIKKHKILLLIIVLASVLRLFNLSNNPPSLYWDEASIAYNAYSILRYGVDEHGQSYPLTHFLAYGDAKPPLYIYATSVAMAIVGIKDVAVRLPSALAGVGAIWLTYLLAMHLARKLSIPWVKPKQFGIVSAIMLTVSPWHLQMSRAGFEANLALTFFLAGMLAFFVASKQPRYYLLSAISFVATWYTFNSYRIFLPLLFIPMAIVAINTLYKHRKWVILSGFLGLSLTMPLLPFVFSDQARLRFNEVTIFNNHQPVIDSVASQQLLGSPWWSKVVFNRRIYFMYEFLDHYFDHFKVSFLFFEGDANPRLGPRDMGMMYLIELPLLLIGLFYVIKQKKKISFLLIVWWLLAIIPGAIARETPHALRVLQVLPIPQLFVAVGVLWVWNKKKKLRWGMVIAYSISVLYYLNLYHVHNLLHWNNSWQYGYKQAVEYVQTRYDDYDKIFVTQTYGRPHTYFLYYTQYDPNKYVANRDILFDDFGLNEVYGFDKYYFKDPDGEQPDDERWLFVNPGNVNVADSTIQFVVKDLKDNPVFIIHE